MARLLKNPDIATGALGVRLPIGSNTLSDTPVTGLIRFNSSNNRVEFYYNNAWNQIAKIGTVPITVDSFTGDGSTSTFTMTQAESDPKSIAVFVGGVYQQPTTNYTVDGSTTITFGSPPPAVTGISPTAVVVIHNINSTNVPA